MEKQPTKAQLVQILLVGLGCLSFGLWFIWIPIIGIPLLFFGSVCILLVVITVATILLHKVLK